MCAFLDNCFAPFSSITNYLNAVRLQRIHNRPLCPVIATYRAFQLTPDCSGEGPAFGDLTSHKFVNINIKTALTAAGYDPSQYGTHSSHRGGATYAHTSGMSTGTIRIIGDWKSSAFKTYIFESCDHMWSEMREIHV